MVMKMPKPLPSDPLGNFQCGCYQHENNQIDRCGDWRKKTTANMNGSGQGEGLFGESQLSLRGSDNTKSAPLS
jgi:hypothetical protein